LLLIVYPFIVVIHGNRQDFFGIVLADHVFIKEFFDLGRPAHIQFEIGGIARTPFLFGGEFLGYDLLGVFHAVLTDMTILAGNENFYLIAAAATKRTMQLGSFCH